MDRLKDKVAVITQAGSYFGRAVAEAYAEEGAKLYLQDWEERTDVIEDLAANIKNNNARLRPEFGTLPWANRPSP